MGMGDEWRCEWGLEMLMLIFAVRSIGREMELRRGCTWMIEGFTRLRGQRARYQLVDEVKSDAAAAAGETRGMRMVDLGVFT
jgi:hypothetical protein